MAYCTIEDIKRLVPEQLLAELTTESGTVPDEAVVNEAIAKADALINAYCGRQYLVPFDPVPEIIESLSLDITVYRLYLRRSVVPDPARQRYEDAVRFLQDVAAGKAIIGDANISPGSASGSNVADIEANERVFTRGSMVGL